MKKIIAICLLAACSCFAIEEPITTDTTHPRANLAPLQGIQGMSKDLRVFIRENGIPYSFATNAVVMFYYATNLNSMQVQSLTNISANVTNKSVLFRTPPLPPGNLRYAVSLIENSRTNDLGTGLLVVYESTFGGNFNPLPGQIIDWSTFTWTGSNQPVKSGSATINGIPLTNNAAIVVGGGSASITNGYGIANTVTGGVNVISLNTTQTDARYLLQAATNGLVTASITNGLATTSWASLNFYPTTANPSNYITTAALAGYATFSDATNAAIARAATDYLVFSNFICLAESTFWAVDAGTWVNNVGDYIIFYGGAWHINSYLGQNFYDTTNANVIGPWFVGLECSPYDHSLVDGAVIPLASAAWTKLNLTALSQLTNDTAFIDGAGSNAYSTASGTAANWSGLAGFSNTVWGAFDLLGSAAAVSNYFAAQLGGYVATNGIVASGAITDAVVTISGLLHTITHTRTNGISSNAFVLVTNAPANSVLGVTNGVPVWTSTPTVSNLTVTGSLTSTAINNITNLARDTRTGWLYYIGPTGTNYVTGSNLMWPTSTADPSNISFYCGAPLQATTNANAPATMSVQQTNNELRVLSPLAANQLTALFTQTRNPAISNWTAVLYYQQSGYTIASTRHGIWLGTNTTAVTQPYVLASWLSSQDYLTIGTNSTLATPGASLNGTATGGFPGVADALVNGIWLVCSNLVLSCYGARFPLGYSPVFHKSNSDLTYTNILAMSAIGVGYLQNASSNNSNTIFRVFGFRYVETNEVPRLVP